MKWVKTTMMAALTVAAAGLASGCASTEEDEYVETTTTQTAVTESSGAQPTYSEMMDEVVIPLHEEEIKVGKRTIDSGQVTIRKVVTSETISQPVELRKESLVIERRGAGTASQSTAPASSSPLAERIATPFEEGVVTIPLRSEEAVVEKTTVSKGEVVAKRNIGWDKQTIQRDVRREDISVDKSGDVSVGGDVNIDEAAGAESEIAPQEE
jgi:uncharacterized protein (TIGR02271 family)